MTALQRLVVGQQAGLQELSLLLAMHALGRSGSRAPNAVILGPTGVGKTHALAVASRALGLPFATTDATLLVPSGIVGEQVEDVLEALVDAAGARLDASRVPRRRSTAPFDHWSPGAQRTVQLAVPSESMTLISPRPPS